MALNANAASGVYGSIKDLTDRIRKATVTRAAFVGGAQKGEVGKPVFITDHTQFKEEFGGKNPRFSFLHYCVDPYLYQSSSCYVMRVINGALWAGAWMTVDDPHAQNPKIRLTTFTEDGTNRPLGKDDPENTIGFDPSQAGMENVCGFFYAKDPGKWNNKITVEIDTSNPLGVPVRGEGHDTNLFWVYVYYDKKNSATPPVEKHLCSLREAVNGNGQQTFITDVLETQSDYIRFKVNRYCPTFEMVTTAYTKFDGGIDGKQPTFDQIAEAWKVFEDTETYQINLLVNCGYADPIVHHEMNRIAELRKDSMAILDMPSDKQTVVKALAYKKNELNLSSYHSAIYTPDVEVYDDENDMDLYVPISGYVASRFAYTDDNFAEWFAPAGVNRGAISILGTKHHYDQGARDAFDEGQINMVRKLPQGGYAIWEQRTTQSNASALQNVNVVRLSKMILVSSMLAMRSQLFEPNDVQLWNFLRQNADDFMRPIKAGRGVYTFKNICDETNNKPETIDNGDVVMDMLYEPTIAARRVHVNFNLNKTGDFSVGDS